jgi:hypothetical protein
MAQGAKAHKQPPFCPRSDGGGGGISARHMCSFR